MRSDLEMAKNYLESRDCTCVLCRGEQFLASHRRGVSPLIAFLDSGQDFHGFSAADKVVGKATAFLYCLLGVKEVYARVLSREAARILTEGNIAVSWDVLVDGIRNRTNTGPCPMEQATKDSRDPEQALAAIRQTLDRLRQTS